MALMRRTLAAQALVKNALADRPTRPPRRETVVPSHPHQEPPGIARKQRIDWQKEGAKPRSHRFFNSSSISAFQPLS